MKISAAVKKETLHIAVGTAVLTAGMLAVFAVLGRFDRGVVLGALLGGCFAVLNFFILGLTVQSAVEIEDEKKRKLKIQNSYSLRMVAHVAVGLAGIQIQAINGLAVIIEFLFPRITIFVMGLLMNRKKGG